MSTEARLPNGFLRELATLEAAYLTETDPIRQSGFGGGPARWRAEREPILNAVDADGDFLDIGCANGYLLECLMVWGQERGITITPFGLDQGVQLIAMARQRLSAFTDHFFVGNAWDWNPPRQFHYVYTLYDCVPVAYLGAYLGRVRKRVVMPGGRLIVRAYGSRSRGIPPFDVAGFLQSLDWEIAGTAAGGDPPVAVFAWIDRVVE